MTPDERQMISDLFDRMRGVSVDKDRDAESLINQRVRSSPDAAYLLVQSVLMQEFALQQSTARIEELEEQMRQMESAGQPQRSSGSFLGGLFGGSRQAEPPRSSSVPAFGSRPASSPWGNQSSAGYNAPPRGAPGPMGAPMQQPAGVPASGGFLKGAMAAAAGVAGGMLLAESVRNMMGGSPASASTTGGHGTDADNNDPASGSHYNETSYEDNDPASGSSDDGWDSGNGNDIDL